jgi:predicted nucleotidyltransferase
VKGASLSHSEIAMLHSVFRSHPAVREVRLFGSRAKGTHRSYSDIDLAIWGNVTPLQAQAIAAELDDLPLPYQYDVQVFDAVKSQELRAHIDRVGIALFPKPATQLISDEEEVAATVEACLQNLADGRMSFWEVVLHTSPEDLKEIIEKALRATDGSYRRVADLLHIEKNEYRRFMDFLRRRNCLVDFRPFRKSLSRR